eukprot:ANDGO_01680.mRNA.1 hypothetical protein
MESTPPARKRAKRTSRTEAFASLIHSFRVSDDDPQSAQSSSSSIPPHSAAIGYPPLFLHQQSSSSNPQNIPFPHLFHPPLPPSSSSSSSSLSAPPSSSAPSSSSSFSLPFHTSSNGCSNSQFPLLPLLSSLFHVNNHHHNNNSSNNGSSSSGGGGGALGIGTADLEAALSRKQQLQQPRPFDGPSVSATSTMDMSMDDSTYRQQLHAIYSSLFSSESAQLGSAINHHQQMIHSNVADDDNVDSGGDVVVDDADHHCGNHNHNYDCIANGRGNTAGFNGRTASVNAATHVNVSANANADVFNQPLPIVSVPNPLEKPTLMLKAVISPNELCDSAITLEDDDGCNASSFSKRNTDALLEQKTYNHSIRNGNTNYGNNGNNGNDGNDEKSGQFQMSISVDGHYWSTVLDEPPSKLHLEERSCSSVPQFAPAKDAAMQDSECDMCAGRVNGTAGSTCGNHHGSSNGLSAAGSAGEVKMESVAASSLIDQSVFAAVFSVLQTPAAIVRIDERVVAVNSAFTAAFGWTNEDITRNVISFRELLTDDDYPVAIDCRLRLLNTDCDCVIQSHKVARAHYGSSSVTGSNNCGRHRNASSAPLSSSCASSGSSASASSSSSSSSSASSSSASVYSHLVGIGNVEYVPSRCSSTIVRQPSSRDPVAYVFEATPWAMLDQSRVSTNFLENMRVVNADGVTVVKPPPQCWIRSRLLQFIRSSHQSMPEPVMLLNLTDPIEAKVLWASDGCIRLMDQKDLVGLSLGAIRGIGNSNLCGILKDLAHSAPERFRVKSELLYPHNSVTSVLWKRGPRNGGSEALGPAPHQMRIYVQGAKLYVRGSVDGLGSPPSGDSVRVLYLLFLECLTPSKERLMEIPRLMQETTPY